MKLVFDAERLRNLNSGLGQYCRSLGKALMRQRPEDWDVTFIVPPSEMTIFGPEARHLRTKWWMRMNAPVYADVWHAAHQDVWIRPPAAAKVVLSIMDLNFLERSDYSPKKKARRLEAVQEKIDRASAIATISEYTASVVRHHLDVGDIPVRAIHLGNPLETPTPLARPASGALAALAPGKFFVFVGVLHPKKNVHTLISVMRAFPDLSLVLAGPNDSPYARDVVTKAREAGVENRVVLPGAIDDATKRWLYANSRALLFPSLSEGFGLPVVEAMSFGKPAFLSRLTSLPEIGGDAAYYFDSFDTDAMVDVIRRGLAEFDADPGAASKRVEWAGKFSWERAARSYWDLYREVQIAQRR
jgi:glycosyltransferase involved in cell wall biosynthesis